jgi:hypothetical protein
MNVMAAIRRVPARDPAVRLRFGGKWLNAWHLFSNRTVELCLLG